jgi:hypothetical protein
MIQPIIKSLQNIFIYSKYIMPLISSLLNTAKITEITQNISDIQQQDTLTNGIQTDAISELQTIVNTIGESIETISHQVENRYDNTYLNNHFETLGIAYTRIESDIFNAQMARKNDTYTKLQTDDLLDGKADASDVYSKSETSQALNDLVRDLMYTKIETDALLDDKANVADHYDKNQVDALTEDFVVSDSVYTKAESNALRQM